VPAPPPRPAPAASASLERPLSRNAHNQPPYPCGIWRWLNPETGEIRPYNCGSWRCPKCSPRAIDRWARIIGEAPVQRHVVLTALGDNPELARRRFHHITQGIRRGELGGFPRRPWLHEWFGALEGHQKGGYHVHLLQWGHYLPQRHLSRLSASYGAGRVVWCRAYDPRPTEGDLRRYVVRHLVGTVHPKQHKPGRRVRYSRNFWEGRSVRQVADELWPPDQSGPWVLEKPDLVAREIAAEDWRRAKSDFWEDITLRQLLRMGWSDNMLLRAGLLREVVE